MTKREVKSKQPRAGNAVTEVNCPGCNFKQFVGFKRPGFMREERTVYRCDTCVSEIACIFSTKSDTQVNIRAKVLVPSATLKEIRQEEEKMREDNPDDRDTKV